MPLDSEFYAPADDASARAITDRAIELARDLTRPGQSFAFRTASGAELAKLIGENAAKLRAGVSADHADLARTVIGIAEALREGRDAQGDIIAEFDSLTVSIGGGTRVIVTAFGAEGAGDCIAAGLEGWMKDALRILGAGAALPPARTTPARSAAAALKPARPAAINDNRTLHDTAERLANAIIEGNLTFAALDGALGKSALHGKSRGYFSLHLHGIEGTAPTAEGAIHAWLSAVRDTL